MRSDPTEETWEDVAKFGLAVAAVGLFALAVVSTGGGALAFAGVGVAAASATTAVSTAAVTTIAVGLAVTGGAALYHHFSENDITENRTSASQMQERVKKGKTPKDVSRVDGTALNYGGSPSHTGKGIPQISKAVKHWLLKMIGSCHGEKNENN